METTRILIGYDGSSASHGIVDDLRRAGLPSEAECHVVTFTEDWVPSEDERAFKAAVTTHTTAPATRGVLSLEKAQRLSLEYADVVRAAFPRWSVTAEAHADAPEYGLVDAASAWPADLLVVGTHGRSALMRAILGSVSQNVLAHAQCPVRISRAPSAHVGALRAIVATDGSPLSVRAIETVARRLWPPGSAVKVVTVDELLAVSVVTGATMPAGIGITSMPGVEALRVRVDTAADLLAPSGLAIECHVLDGVPSDAILAEARRWGADVIFVGAQGHSLFDRMTLGSVSAAIAAHAPCSVEVIR